MKYKVTKQIKQFPKEYFTDIYISRTRERAAVYQYRLAQIIKKMPKMQRILDVGCALGEFLSQCDRLKIKTYGMDVSEYAVNQARKNTKAALTVHDATTSPWPYKNNFFDVVTIFDVIEHVKPTDSLFAEALRVLKPGGFLYATTRNDQGKLKKLIDAILPDDPTHINIKSADEWRGELGRVGFKEIEIRGAIFYGLPPSTGWRIKFQKIGIPTIVRPIFFPLKYFTGALVICVWKPTPV